METAVLVSDVLQRLPIDKGKGRAQRRMSSHDAIQRTLQCVRIQRPA
ncbi:hypothetical protein [Xanthomonas sp. MUS 060]|nr:hypothetical protein [Xanthomonas sp. MUS 060]